VAVVPVRADRDQVGQPKVVAVLSRTRALRAREELETPFDLSGHEQRVGGDHVVLLLCGRALL
jgi:hypothetical protein